MTRPWRLHSSRQLGGSPPNEVCIMRSRAESTAALMFLALAAACDGSPAGPQRAILDAPVGASAPAAPDGLTASATVTQAVLTWPDSPDETYYRLQRALAPLNGPIGSYSLVTRPDQDAV